MREIVADLAPEVPTVEDVARPIEANLPKIPTSMTIKSPTGQIYDISLH